MNAQTDQNIVSEPFQYLLQHAGMKKRNLSFVTRNLAILQAREMRNFVSLKELAKLFFQRNFREKKIIFLTLQKMLLSYALISMSSESQFNTLA